MVLNFVSRYFVSRWATTQNMQSHLNIYGAYNEDLGKYRYNKS